MTLDDFAVSRRAVVAGASAVAAAAALTACTTYGKDDPAPAPQPATPAPNAPAGESNATKIAAVKDVPVGGGVIAGDVVVTQPSAGTFVGLSATCTHAGCKVATVSEGTINCNCHGSKYGLDGSVVKGPAPKALATKNVRVEGDSIVLG